MTHQENGERSLTPDEVLSQGNGSVPGFSGARITKVGTCYLNYLNTTLGCVLEQQAKIGHLYSLIESSQQVHVFGFGRSGSAALSLAIRLRHFCDYIPAVWWMGDEVRQPVREHDLVILFSGSGERKEVELVAKNAKKSRAVIVLVTGEEHSRIGEVATIIIVLPKMKDQVCYGGGDFELAAYVFQELLVTLVGQYREIPADVVGKHHV
jgi:D-arabinose 5-phosphate isomerase GutQ